MPSLILLSGSQVALEEDLEALKEHLSTAEKFSLIPITPSQATPAIPAIPGVPGVQGVPTSGTVSPPRAKALQVLQGSAELSDHVKARKVPYKSVSELLMKLYPTVPMQTQVLADYCTACLEEALTVYCIERLTSACGNGMLSSPTVSVSSTVSNVSPPIPDMDSPRTQPPENQKLKRSISSPLSSALRGNTGLSLLERGKGSVVPLKLNIRGASEVSMSQDSSDAVDERDGDRERDRVGERDRDRERRKDSNAGSSSFTPVQDPLCIPFLRLLHSALCAAPASPFFLNRSSGILHMPFLLPKHLSLSLRTQIVERILEAYPTMQTFSGDLFCDPLFPGKNVPPVSTESGSEITDNHENIPMWCEAATPLNSAANSVNLTFFGAAYLFPSVASSCGVSGVGVQSVSPSSNSLLRRVEMTSRSVEDELNGTGAGTLTSLPLSASTSAVAQLVSRDSNNSINTIINNNSNNNSNNINTMSAQQADIRDRARANSNDSRGRDRSTSFTPPIAPTPLGDFRSLVDYDSLIAGTLPLWLRRRAYSLEVAVTADGIFLFFFNLSSAVLNTVCELSATVAAMGVRAYNEQIRQQLIVLGVLKNKILPPIRSLEVLELELNKSEDTMTLSTASSPLKAGGVTLFTGLTGSNGGSGVGVRSAMQATSGVWCYEV